MWDEKLVQLKQAMKRFCIWLLRDKSPCLKQLCEDIASEAWVELIEEVGKETASRQVTVEGRLDEAAERMIRNTVRRTIRRQIKETQYDGQERAKACDPMDTDPVIERFCQRITEQLPVKRQQAINLIRTGHKQREVAERLGVCLRTVRYWIEDFETQLVRGV